MKTTGTALLRRINIVVLVVGLFSSVPCFGESNSAQSTCKEVTLLAIAGAGQSRTDRGCPTSVKGVKAESLDPAMSINLQAPSNLDDRRELGLPENAEQFKLGDLQADLLVVLVFDMYCHVCHQSSENMQAVADQLKSSSQVQSVCILGLGRGDTDFEVQTFVKKLGLKFPCVSDRDKSVTDALGVQYTPSGYLFCRKTGDYRLISSFSGYLSKKKTETFLAPVFAEDR